MNRREYIERLEQLLLILPEEEREEALQYYSDYFDDAGVENEERVILELGSPEEVAAKIRAGYAGEYGEYSEQGYEDVRFQNTQEIITKEVINAKTNEDWKDSVYEAKMQEESKGGYKKENNNMWKVIAIIVLVLCATPIIIPLGIALLAVVFALVVTLLAVVVGVGISGFAIALAGIIVIVAGVARILLAPAVGILAAGIGCILLAIGVLISWAMVSLAVKVVPGVLRGIVNILGTPFRKAGVR